MSLLIHDIDWPPREGSDLGSSSHQLVGIVPAQNPRPNNEGMAGMENVTMSNNHWPPTTYITYIGWFSGG